ncbi:2620_t:CDS:10 [Funneliformis caledonium]|uniref:2620_t:CDS:1 n=1 Tax=Funneliformis caledonium TaxID=1117310 RepID=A0A9N8WID2_9GLOM|nr:2620_t:CDS:10 [Funneliformis caledonium]
MASYEEIKTELNKAEARFGKAVENLKEWEEGSKGVERGEEVIGGEQSSDGETGRGVETKFRKVSDREGHKCKFEGEEEILSKKACQLEGNIPSLNVGDFRKLVSGGYTFIDKSHFIEEFIVKSSDYVILLRLRRFEKSINLSMLKEFFDIPIHPDNLKFRQELFKGLNITKRTFLDLMTVKALTGDKSLQLSEYLYDHPFEIAFHENYFDDARKLLTSILSPLLKGNDANLYKALIVEVSYVAKAGLFFGLNNLTICPMYDELYVDKFGFTEDEISAIINHYNVSNISLETSELDNVKNYYNSYICEIKTKIYNPMSIISYMFNKKLKPYWVIIGGLSKSIKMLILHSNQFISLASGFMSDEKIDAPTTTRFQSLDYEILRSCRTTDELLILLYFGEYLIKDTIDNKLFISNKETHEVWKYWLNIAPNERYNPIFKSLSEYNFEKFVFDLKRIFDSTSVSYMNITTEKYYYCLMIESNLEAGLGCLDIVIQLTSENSTRTFIFEFKSIKRVKKNKQTVLEKETKAGIEQINRKQYVKSITRNELITKIAKCAICFCSKDLFFLLKSLKRTQRMNGN